MTFSSRLAGLAPWWSRILAKLLLARLPVPRSWWLSLGVFRHGPGEDPAYAWRVLQAHLEPYRHATGGGLPRVMLELGPGDCPYTGPFAASLGVGRILLVDAAPFLAWGEAAWARAQAFLDQQQPGLRLAPGTAWSSHRTEYLTQGLASLQRLPDGSVDLLWSQAVLEHVPLDEVPALLRQMARVVRPGGLLSHRIDLKDHLGGGLNHLRFSGRVWESRLFRRSGFYTNRLRPSQFLQRFEEAGFEVVSCRVEQWAAPPLAPGRLAPAFRDLPGPDLAAQALDVVLRPRRSGP